jgi:predicted NAD/FAD-binding protein
LPTNPKAWAAWNYERGAGTAVSAMSRPQVCLHYLINKLQPIPFTQPVVVSLNPIKDISPDQVLGEYDYSHPVFDLDAINAQARVPTLQGQQHTYFCGAWMGYGFHEDGLKAGQGVARHMSIELDNRPEVVR